MINEKLTNSLLNGCGLKGILNTLAVEMNCALLLENSHRQLIEASDSLRKIYLNSADYVREKVETVDIKEKCNTNRVKVSSAKGYTFEKLISPVFVRNNIFGYVSLIRESEGFSELDYIVIEKAASICAMQIINETSAFENEQRIKGELLNAVFRGEFSEEELTYRLKLMGYNLNQPQYVFLFHLDSGQEFNRKELEDSLNHYKTAAAENLNKLFKQQGFACIMTTKVNQLIAVIPEDFIRQFSSEVSCGQWLIDQIFSEIKPFEMKLGISSLCQQASDLKKGLKEAEKTIKIMKFSKSNAKVKAFKELLAVAKLICSENLPEMEAFAHTMLQKIKNYDDKHGSDLLETLFWYVENNGHLYKTAERMHVSLGYVRYRLKKMQEIGGFDLSSSQGFFDVHAAVNIYLFLGLIEVKMK